MAAASALFCALVIGTRPGRSDEEGGPIDNRFGFDNSDSPWCLFLLFGTMNMNYELC